MQYRQQALAKVRAGDELGSPLRLTTPQSWIVLVTLLLIVAAAGTWAAVGSLPHKITASGILTHQLGAYAVYSNADGQVSEVAVQPGSTVAAGGDVLTLTHDATKTVVRAVAPGQVVEVLAAMGQYVTVGAVVARVEAVDPRDGRLVAVLYAPAGSGAAIQAGADVDVFLPDPPRGAAGRLRGTVASVSQIPETKAQVGQFLGDDGLAERFTARGSPLKVVVSLTAVDGAADGPASPAGGTQRYRISARTLVTGAVHLPDTRPVEWLLPR